MARRVTTVSAPVAHLVGPGKLQVINGQLNYLAQDTRPVRLILEELNQLLIYGPVSLTEGAVGVLMDHDVQVSFLTPAGLRCKGRLVRPDSPRTGLRCRQHRVLGQEHRQTEWARDIVVAKIDTQREAARHYQRHGVAGAGEVLARLTEARERCGSSSLEQLRGVEGAASAAWFGLLGSLFQPPWEFKTRTRRPPTDPVNALLSLGYTCILNRTVARVEAAGLEVYLGGLHEWRPGRPSLACDLMEPLRLPGVDRWVLSLLNQQKVGQGDFQEIRGGIQLQEGRLGRILSEWETHWVQSKQEAVLEQWLQRLIRWLREVDDPSGEAITLDDGLNI